MIKKGSTTRERDKELPCIHIFLTICLLIRIQFACLLRYNGLSDSLCSVLLLILLLRFFCFSEFVSAAPFDCKNDSIVQCNLMQPTRKRRAVDFFQLHLTSLSLQPRSFLIDYINCIVYWMLGVLLMCYECVYFFLQLSSLRPLCV